MARQNKKKKNTQRHAREPVPRHGHLLMPQQRLRLHPEAGAPAALCVTARVGSDSPLPTAHVWRHGLHLHPGQAPISGGIPAVMPRIARLHQRLTEIAAIGQLSSCNQALGARRGAVDQHGDDLLEGDVPCELARLRAQEVPTGRTTHPVGEKETAFPCRKTLIVSPSLIPTTVPVNCSACTRMGTVITSSPMT